MDGQPFCVATAHRLLRLARVALGVIVPCRHSSFVSNHKRAAVERPERWIVDMPFITHTCRVEAMEFAPSGRDDQWPSFAYLDSLEYRSVGHLQLIDVRDENNQANEHGKVINTPIGSRIWHTLCVVDDCVETDQELHQTCL